MSKHSSSEAYQNCVGRRKFIRTSSAIFLGCWTGLLCADIRAQTVGNDLASLAPIQQFHRLASFLADRPDLNVELSATAFNMLSAQDPQFQITLQQIIHTLGTPTLLENFLTTMHACLENPKKNATLCQNTANLEQFTLFTQQILNTLYTGKIGQGSQAKLVTYEHALMYIPTQNVTGIPSYSQAGQNYWSLPPKNSQA